MKKILTACFVLSMALFILGFSGCDGMLSDADGGNGFFSNYKSESSESRGQLKITGIDSGLSGSYRVYVSSSNNSYTSNIVASGSVSIGSSTSPVTVSLNTGSSSSSLWNGTGSYHVFFEDSYGLALRSISSVSFTNGSASVTGSSFIVTGRLTITGISSDFYGTYDVYVNSSNNESSYKTGATAYAFSVTINSSTVTSSTARVNLRASGGSGSSSRWNNTGPYFVFIEDNTGQLVAKSGQISFTNGSTSISMNSFTGITPGRLTVTGISSGSLSNGTYNVYVNSSNDERYYDITPRASGSVTISSSDSIATVNLFTYGSSSPWSDTGPYFVFIEDNAGQLVAKSNQISFTNGSASVDASIFTEITPGRLTITGVSSLYGITIKVDVRSDAVNTVASGTGTINSSAIIIDLYTANAPSSRWNYTDYCYVYLEYDDGLEIQTRVAYVEFVRGTATVSFNDFIDDTSPSSEG